MENSFTLWSHPWSLHLKRLEVQCHKIQEVLLDNDQGYPDQYGQLVLPPHPTNGFHLEILRNNGIASTLQMVAS